MRVERFHRTAVLGATASAAFLFGLWLEGFIRVMWVEDQVGPEGFAVVDLVNQATPAGSFMRILALVVTVVLVGIAMATRQPPAATA